ncbi:MAG TPA: Rid family detoxifying hydrolase [Pseudomonadales bacterium]|jgi:reactive intermediate/imine deaminase|nr:Rid family detoxifying hydrolase [Pseudomonadales bacterium]HMW14970.1 Rid family detoxifying hydrolase [Pseudomonadales bacterium]HMW82997.1 Rid family detoxifying hydrolase [Pseudomonadales bacterium]HMY96730.1 Rid family detoxifying hydrolase [Pseudomonadales bacterium]HMZ70445.1 Rid family detoxifying hydrolase [Pseudomonadales bacterium]
MNRRIIRTDQAPQAIGTYSQAVEAQGTLYVSGQIALDPVTMVLVNDSIENEITQVFNNLQAVVAAAGMTLDEAVKLNIYLTDLIHFATLNQIMARFFNEPYPARAAVGVAQLPRGARVEVDAVVVRR